MQISVKLSELHFIPLPSTAEINLYSNRLATELLRKFGATEVSDIIRFSSAIRVRKQVLAYEHFFILQALQRLMPNLEVELTVQNEKSLELATQRIVRYVAITSFTSFDAMQASSFEKKSQESLPYTSLFQRFEWKVIADCDRTVFNYHDKKFMRTVIPTKQPVISLDDELAKIPPTGGDDE